MPQVKLPSGEIVEFPYSMSDDEIVAAIKQMDIPTQEKPGLMENIWGKGEIDTPGEKLGATIQDVIRSTFGGAAKGTAALAGIPGSLGNLAQSGMVGGINKLLGTDLQTPPPSTVGIGPMTDAMSTVTGGRSEYEPQTTAGEFGRTVGEYAPGAALFGGVSPANIGKFAVAPGIASEFAGQVTEGDPIEPYARMAAGIATPGALTLAKNLGMRAITPHPATPQATQAAQVLDDAGVRLTAGQQTGSNTLKLQEKMTTGGARLTEQASDDFTAAAMRSINSDAPTASRAAIANAYDDIGGMFDDLATRYNAVADKTLLDDVTRAAASYTETAGQAVKMPFNIVDDIKSAFDAGKPLTGAQYQDFSSRLGRLLKSSDGATREVAHDLRWALDDALERSMTLNGATDALAQWKEARRLYTNLLVVSRAAGTAAGRDGTITPAALGNAVKVVQGNKNLVTGATELGPLADAGAVAFKAPYGTEAAFRNKDLRGILGSALGGGAAGTALSGGNPIVGLGTAALSAGLPKAAQSLAATARGQQYLANQAFISPAQALLDKRLLGTIASGMANR